MTKKLLSLTLTLLMLFSFMLPAFASGDTTAADTTAATEADKKGDAFNYEDAGRAAVAAAKSKFIISGLSAEEANLAGVTKMSFDEDENVYTVTVRSGNKHKFTCTISVSKVFGKELGFAGNGEYAEQNVVWGFICKQFEKLSYYFFKKSQ
ncbi:MAG: hypothetical protein IKA56_06070 [Clostridia bacterium]|nr:hypothetical protein [Clostridia bacterium]